MGRPTSKFCSSCGRRRVIQCCGLGRREANCDASRCSRCCPNLPYARRTIEEAIAFVGAVDVGPQHLAYRESEDGPYYVANTSALHELQQLLIEHGTARVRADEDQTLSGPLGTIAYAYWCSSIAIAEMPRWWRPDRRQAWCISGIHLAFTTEIDAYAYVTAHAMRYPRVYLVTADLSNGKEFEP